MNIEKFTTTLPSRHLFFFNQKKKKPMNLIELVWRIIQEQGASTASELTEILWEEGRWRAKSKRNFNRAIIKALNTLFAKGKITKLNFRTERGFVYGLSREKCFEYLFKNDLAPERLLKQFFFLLGEKGFVTNLELKDLGFKPWQIRKWIERKLGREGCYIKIHRVNNELRVYYYPRYENQLELYLRSEEFKEIYEEWKKRREPQKLGRALEEVVEEIYKKMGYEFKKQFAVLWKDKVIAVLDGLALKRKGNDYDFVIVECKNWYKPITVASIAHLIDIRNLFFMRRGRIHIFALNGAFQSVWRFLRFHPYVRIFSKKHFKELCKELGINYEGKIRI